jgi:hypothetical protein
MRTQIMYKESYVQLLRREELFVLLVVYIRGFGNAASCVSSAGTRLSAANNAQVNLCAAVHIIRDESSFCFLCCVCSRGLEELLRCCC